MTTKKTLIITSIANDKHPVLTMFAKECASRNVPFVVIGDTKSPATFELEGCDFWSVEKQLILPYELAKITPTRHYSRKNLGYLIAIEKGAEEIVETDDDNIPRAEFWNEKNREAKGNHFEDKGWVNVYKYFTKEKIWPRGFPLEDLHKEQPDLASCSVKTTSCPIQQGLADENPDVDAVYRLTYPLPLNFEIKNRLLLGKNSWSPFNSQNTHWFKEAFPLLYLPSYCSFRMTDIWRSYVAQRIAWECGWSVLYHEPTVWQERNEHNLMKDFEDEIPGYNNNSRICKELGDLKLKAGKENICDNLLSCYQRLVDIEVIGKDEMTLLKAWINDISKLV
ncbi:MAG: STELLO glycosyltransferase family protein [Bacteroidetes bacterium]|nr:STELLO glycosyltransferase family protein [Bacteroidota bacterium]